MDSKKEDKKRKYVTNILAKIKEEWSEQLDDMATSLGQDIFQAVNNYIQDHLEDDIIANYDRSVREELCQEAKVSALNQASDWGRVIRKAIYHENKEEISKLITQDIIRNKDYEIKQLKEDRFYLERRLNELILDFAKWKKDIEKEHKFPIHQRERED